MNAGLVFPREPRSRFAAQPLDLTGIDAFLAGYADELAGQPLTACR